MKNIILCFLAICAASPSAFATVHTPDSIVVSSSEVLVDTNEISIDTLAVDSAIFSDGTAPSQAVVENSMPPINGKKYTLYDYPYSMTRSMPDWRRLWVNTGVLMGGGVTALVILEALPDDATAWNKASKKNTPLFKRWWKHVKLGPVWDGDKFIFNYILHPYAGAAYYMSARSCGFNVWGSFIYGFCISSGFWEYGFEAFNEIPSAQDLLITPVVGMVMGELFYRGKRTIVHNGYRVLGCRPLGLVCAFVLDPVNELIGYFRGEQRQIIRGHNEDLRPSAWSGGSWISPGPRGVQGGLSLTYTF